MDNPLVPVFRDRRNGKLLQVKLLVQNHSFEGSSNSETEAKHLLECDVREHRETQIGEDCPWVVPTAERFMDRSNLGGLRDMAGITRQQFE